MIKSKVEKGTPFLVVKANALGSEIYSMVSVGMNYKHQLTIVTKPIIKKHHFHEFRECKDLFKKIEFGEDGCIYDFNNFKGTVDKRLKKNFLISLK